MDRRIADRSAEVHASVELAGPGEVRIAGDIARMRDKIAQLVAVPAAATSSSGLELEAVVQVKEGAANTIMGARRPSGIGSRRAAMMRAHRPPSGA